MTERIPRRAVLGGLAVALTGFPAMVSGASRSPSIPDGNKVHFDINRNGSVIGAHDLDFHLGGDGFVVEIKVDIVVGFGPITFFRYRHRAFETWKAGQFVSIDAATDDDGKQCRVVGRRVNARIEVTGPRGNYLAPPETLPATHWNRRMLDGPMINTETGALMRPHIRDLGIDTIPTQGGGSIRAHHFNFTGDAVLDTWYDDHPSWAGLRFTAHDGSTIRYERAV